MFFFQNHPQYDHPGTLLCNQCNAALPDFEAFRSHVKTHIDEAGGLRGGSEPRKSPPTLCPHCGAQLTQEELPQHITNHFLTTATEYGCQSCMKLFPKPDELQKHLMDLHAHHLYRCALCKEMFDSKVAIQVPDKIFFLFHRLTRKPLIVIPIYFFLFSLFKPVQACEQYQNRFKINTVYFSWINQFQFF